MNSALPPHASSVLSLIEEVYKPGDSLTLNAQSLGGDLLATYIYHETIIVADEAKESGKLASDVASDAWMRLGDDDDYIFCVVATSPRFQ